MKKYILDSRLFIISRDYYPGNFPSFWKNMSEMITNKTIFSVQEVYEELEKYGGEQGHLLAWIKNNKKIFTQPTLQEQQKVREIFAIKEFQQLISKKNQMIGGPSADPFVIAKASVTHGIVVTGELPIKRDKHGKMQGKPKIPDVCAHFDIPCITPQQFMEEQNWKF